MLFTFSLLHRHPFLCSKYAKILFGIPVLLCSGDEITLFTDSEEEHYTSGWYTVLDAYELVFWVRGMSDANIALTKVAGVTVSGAVEVVIGANGNSR